MGDLILMDPTVYIYIGMQIVSNYNRIFNNNFQARLESTVT